MRTMSKEKLLCDNINVRKLILGFVTRLCHQIPEALIEQTSMPKNQISYLVQQSCEKNNYFFIFLSIVIINIIIILFE